MKYEIIKTDTVKSWDGRTLYRIKRIETGENGGYIEHESNLSHDGDAWVSGDAWVFGDARVFGAAQVFGDAQVESPADYVCVGPVGSRHAFLTGFRDNKKGVLLATGCFLGTTKELRERVAQTHGKNDHGVAYGLAIDLIEARLKHDKEAKPDWYAKGSAGTVYAADRDPEVTCWHCKKTFLCDAMDACCRMCEAPYDKTRCAVFGFVPKPKITHSGPCTPRDLCQSCWNE